MVILGILFCLFAMALFFAIYYSNFVIKVENYTLELNDWPIEFNNFRIAHISDLHAAEFGKENSQVKELLQDIAPDIIVITGDFIDKHIDERKIKRIAKAFPQVAPTYFVPGNHDYGLNKFDQLKGILQQSGIEVLVDSTAEIVRGDDKITILGIDDLLSPDIHPLEATVKKAKSKGGFLITLCHRYDRFEELAEQGLPIIFSGHAHGGLIRFPGTDGLVGPGKKLFPKYTNGMYAIGNSHMLTSRGIGNSGWTLRLFSTPHIPVLTLRSTKRYII